MWLCCADSPTGRIRMLTLRLREQVDDQTRIIENLTGDMDRLNERVEVNKNRVTNIK